MTSAKGLPRFTTPLLLGISLICLSGLDVHAQGTYELQKQQNQREIDRLRQQLDPQRNGVPQRSMPPSSTPGSVTAFDARSIQRSVNLARDTAIRINGGLSRYRPAGCMFKGSDRNPCIAQSGPQGILFEIPGGPPGWEEARALPSIMTVLLISPDGRSLLQTISNIESVLRPAGPSTRIEGQTAQQPLPVKVMQAKCFLKVDGKVFIDSSCEYEDEGRGLDGVPGSFRIDDGKLKVECSVYDPPVSKTCYGYQKRVTRKGTFAGVQVVKKGYGNFWWNMGNSRKGHAGIEGVRQEGACWVNNRVRICAWAL